MKKLRVHENKRHLCWEDGKPFFYMGDTAWELFHRLNKEEIDHYMQERARQGFTVVQAVALAEYGGLTLENPYGCLPLKVVNGTYDPCTPDLDGEYSYWDHVDYALDKAAETGLLVAFLPTWGDKFNRSWGDGPEIFTPENAYRYGLWLGERYRDRWNLLWMLGGDRPLEQRHRPVIDEMARGLREGDRGNHLITFHPVGGTASNDFLNDAPYIDFHTSQTGHDVAKCYESYKEMQRMEAMCDKPFMDSEPRYEDHPACFKAEYGFYWQPEDVRHNAYWNVLQGTCGHTYGNHAIWSVTREPNDYYPYAWDEALTHPGAEQVAFVRKLRESRDYFSYRPDESLVEQNNALLGHLSAGQGDGYAYIYSPQGLPFVAHLQQINAKHLKASWFDPRTGETTAFAVVPACADTQFVPPTSGKDQDWVLILDVLA